MAREIRFRPAARRDVIAIYQYIASEAGDRRALDYIDRIEVACASLSAFPSRGSRRDDLGAGIRILVVERRVTIAYVVKAKVVVIVGVFHAGRDVAVALGRRAD